MKDPWVDQINGPGQIVPNSTYRVSLDEKQAIGLFFGRSQRVGTIGTILACYRFMAWKLGDRMCFVEK